MSALSTTVDLDVIRTWMAPAGFHRILQLDLLDYDPESQRLRLSLPFRDDYARLPHVGDYHGGVLAAALDVAGTFVSALAAGRVVATANLRTDYLRSPVRIDLIATAHIVRAGRTTIVADASLADETGKLFATARGTWCPIATEPGR